MQPDGEFWGWRDLDPQKSMDAKVAGALAAFNERFSEAARYIVMSPMDAQLIKVEPNVQVGVMRVVSRNEFYVTSSTAEEIGWGLVVSVGSQSSEDQQAQMEQLTDPAQPRSQSFRKPVTKRRRKK